MELCLFRLMVDFGLLVLIWMVQLIIYPSFTQFPKDKLTEWHTKYTQAMGFMVGPLMIVQLGIYVVISLNEPTLWDIASSILVLATWLVTFFQFVPMHGLIAKGQGQETLLVKLVTKNWIRTILWSVLFVISCFTCL